MRDNKIAKGHQSLVDGFKERGFNEQEMIEKVNTPAVLKHFNVDSFDDLLILVCNKNVNAGQICDFLKIERKVDHTRLLKDKDRLTSDNKNLS